MQATDAGIDEFLAQRAWLFELSLEPMLVGRFDGFLIAVNASLQRLVGYGLDELLSQPFSQLVHPDDVPLAVAELYRLARGESSRDLELRVACRDGTYRIVNWTASPSPNEGVFYAVGRDVTEWKHHEERISRQAELLELAHDAILGRTSAGVVEYWNHGAEELYGWSRAEAVGQTVHELLGTEFPLPAEEIHSQVDRTGGWEGELRQRCRDGRRIVVLSRWARRNGVGGGDRSMLEINRDITPRKHAEERLVRQTQALMRSNADLEQFAYIASHDLLEPLAVICNYAELLLEGYGGHLPDTAREFTDHILSGGNELRALISDLLTYSRIGRAELRWETVDCNVLVRRVVASLDEVLKNAEVVVESLPTVRADPTQLGQVFQNLMGNAVKFVAPGVRPVVVVEGYDAGDACLFSVSDNGIGVKVEDRTRIFEMFERVNSGAGDPGTGIGLAICARVMERHQGRIWVEEARDGGSRFCFRIPKTGDS